MTKQKQVLDILEVNVDRVLTSNHISNLINGPKAPAACTFTAHMAQRAAYRCIAKGHPVESIKDNNKLVGFRYNSSRIDPDMEYTLPDSKKEDPLDKVLERVTNITKPIETDDEPDLFTSDDNPYNKAEEEGFFDLSEETGDTGLVSSSETITPSRAEVTELVNLPVPFAIDEPDDDNYIYENNRGTGDSDNMPAITPGAAIHLIKAYRPMAITMLNIQTHFGISNAEAIDLLLKVQEQKYRGVTVNISAIAD